MISRLDRAGPWGVRQAAISALHGVSVDGRSIVVTQARSREASTDSNGYSAGGYTATKRPDICYGTGG